MPVSDAVADRMWEDAKNVVHELRDARLEIERLRAALAEIVGLDHLNHGPESCATEIARAALNQSVRSN